MVDQAIEEMLRQLLPQSFTDVVTVPSHIVLRQEQQDTRFPVVIGRHLVVVSEHFRSASEQRGAVEKSRKGGIQDRPDALVVELPLNSSRIQSREHPPTNEALTLAGVLVVIVGSPAKTHGRFQNPHTTPASRPPELPYKGSSG